MNKWHEIWNKRTSNGELKYDLEALISLDGFDSGAGKVSVADWLENARKISDLLGIQDGDSVFEVGCGCGAFLKGLQEMRKIKIGGIDYSSPLIKVANSVFPNQEFVCGEATDIEGIEDYDYLLAHGVFHYFDLNYAENVIKKMILKAKKTICILDIPNLATMEDSEKMRRDLLTENEYKRKYEGLEHTYFEKAWFRILANKLGYNCDFLEGLMPNYAQKNFRFGVIIQK
ncbi:class I SAM-dependent methyltransferase [Gammaproteobacteria bacterium]|jgi:ubiquinone/menaquinone biosynthesis C-methylase UbiE|nr:class I SAM-dependent methyltransferase [Gammaproteobacteria bacterium]